jgi:hypothetical protein
MAAVEWIITMREGLRQSERYADCIYPLHYESLVGNPRDELIRLLDFCELPHDKVFLRFGEQKLSPAPESQPFDMHPDIRPAFDETMKALGY